MFRTLLLNSRVIESHAMKQALTLLVYGFALSTSLCLNAQALELKGFWDMDDDKGQLDTTLELQAASSGEPGIMEGFIRILHLEKDKGAVCSLCSDHRKGQPLIGMKAIENLKPSGQGRWYGQALDPETGKIWNIRLTDDGEDGLDLCVYMATDYVCLQESHWDRSQFAP